MRMSPVVFHHADVARSRLDLYELAIGNRFDPQGEFQRGIRIVVAEGVKDLLLFRSERGLGV